MTLSRASGFLGSIVLASLAGGCGLVLGLSDFTDQATPPGGGGAGGGAATTGSAGGGAGTTTAGGGGSGGGTVDPCANGKKDGNETDKDCGGSCSPCGDGLGCGNGSDCASHVCGQGGLCSAPTCGDGTLNGSETDEDCGGGNCPACAEGLVCSAASDCLSQICQDGHCFAASCGDTVKNGSESDVDCGGSCPPCAPLQDCGGNADCASGICQATKCIDDHVWSKRFGDSDYQTGLDVDMTDSGYVTVLGEFMGSVNLGGGTFTNPCVDDPQTQEPECTPYEKFLAQFAPDGSFLWAKHFQNVSDNYANYGISSAVDGSGYAWIASYGTGSLDFGAGALADPSPGSYDGDITLAQLNSSGVLQWRKRLGDSNDQYVHEIAASPGGVALTGAFAGSVDFGSGSIASSGSLDGFIAKLGNNGVAVWAKRFGEATQEQEGLCVALDAAGNVLVGGAFRLSMSLGTTLTSAGGNDLFLAKLNKTSGTQMWAKRFGDVQDQHTGAGDAIKVATDAAGNVFYSGRLRGSVSFGGGTLTAGAGGDIFVAKLDLNGAHLWSKRFGDAMGKATKLADIAVAKDGGILITGSSAGAVDFGNGIAVQNGFVVKLDGAGNYVWSRPFGGASLAVDGAKGLVMTGPLLGSQDFGGGPLTSAGSSDAFVARFLTP